jgi:hypothetical protein
VGCAQTRLPARKPLARAQEIVGLVLAALPPPVRLAQVGLALRRLVAPGGDAPLPPPVPDAEVGPAASAFRTPDELAPGGVDRRGVK